MGETLVAKARQHFGPKPQLYTTDCWDIGHIRQGSLPGDVVYTVGDWGPMSTKNIDQAFANMKAYNAPGKSPNLVTEFYPGWLTHWGEKQANKSTSPVVNSMDYMMSHKN